MILQSLDQLLDDVPVTLKKLRGQLRALGDPCESVVEKKSYFDDISHKMSPRLQQLLEGFSNQGDHAHILLNSNIQKFLKRFEEKFGKGSIMIFDPKFCEEVRRCLGKFPSRIIRIRVSFLVGARMEQQSFFAFIQCFSCH